MTTSACKTPASAGGTGGHARAQQLFSSLWQSSRVRRMKAPRSRVDAQTVFTQKNFIRRTRRYRLTSAVMSRGFFYFISGQKANLRVKN